MYCEDFTVIIAGVGGQGTLLASTLIGNAVVKSGAKVRISETFGLSQRGGSVVTHIRVGEKVYSPLTPLHTADLIIGFEPLETYRNVLKFLKPKGNVFYNTRPIYSSEGKKAYPSVKEMDTIMKQLATQVVAVDAVDLAIKAGDPVMMNMVMLGASSSMLPISEQALRNAIREGVKKNVNANLLAFDYGVQAASQEKFARISPA